MGEVDMTRYYDNLPDNSHQGRAEKKQQTPVPERKRAEKIVQGTVKTKKNDIRKLTDMFISEDAANIKNYVLYDVLIPVVKKAIYDIVVGSVDMSLFGGRGSSSSGKRPIADRVSFRDYNGVSRRDERSYSGSESRSNTVYSYDDVVVPTRGEAEDVLERMREMLETYNNVRVADLYDMVGVTGEYTDNNYGWTNLRNAEVVRTYDGYKIKLPRAMHLK